jgi:hypothetical protein
MVVASALRKKKQIEDLGGVLPTIGYCSVRTMKLDYKYLQCVIFMITRERLKSEAFRVCKAMCYTADMDNTCL